MSEHLSERNIHTNLDIDSIDCYCSKKIISYPERWRDWPFETSAAGLLRYCANYSG
jgi:hypothetical protein